MMKVLALALTLSFTLAAAALADCPGHVNTADNGNVVASNSQSSAPMTKIPPKGQQQGS
jgi:hypothetical protein